MPLATAVARDNLGPARSRPTISLVGITTAAGIGIGYPMVGALAQFLGVHAPFWLAAALSAACLVAAVALLPPSPDLPAPFDAPGAALLGLAVSGLLLALAQGPLWGWGSPTTIGLTVLGPALLAAWTAWELRTDHPLIDLSQLHRRPVLAANLTIGLVALGFHPLSSLVVRYVQTPTGSGYGFGASIIVAGLILTHSPRPASPPPGSLAGRGRESRRKPRSRSAAPPWPGPWPCSRWPAPTTSRSSSPWPSTGSASASSSPSPRCR